MADTPRTYGNWRQPRSAGIGNLSMTATMVLIGGVLVTLVVMLSAGLVAAVVALAVVAALGAAANHKDSHERTVFQNWGARAVFLRSRRDGTNLYRSGPIGRAGGGSCQLPGLVARTSVSEHLDSYGYPFAMVELAGRGHYTVVVGVSPDGQALVDQEQVDVWVAQYGHWHASLGHDSSLIAAAVTIETAPDTGSRLATEVRANLDVDAPPLAREVLEDIVLSYPEGSAAIRAWVALTFKSRARGKEARDEMARHIGQVLPGLTGHLQSTGAGQAAAMTVQDLSEIVRVAYDPSAGPTIDEHYAYGAVPELDWSDIGPAAHQANWSSYVHDGAQSVTWMMTGAPRGIIYSSHLHQLLAPHPDVARKRVTLLYRPIDPGTAASIVESDRATALFRATKDRRTGASARAGQEVKAAEATAMEEALGAGLTQFGMLVTATVQGGDDKLGKAQTAIGNLTKTARLQLRVAYGCQDSAFAAGLPLGLVLSEHLNVPKAVRSALR